MNNHDSVYERYQELENLINNAGNTGLSVLSGHQLIRLGQLYRQAAAELSTAKTHNIDDTRIEYLNSLVGKAYGYVYQAERRPLPSISRFYQIEFPQVFRKNLHFISVAFLIFALAALMSGIAAMKNPDLANRIFGPGTYNTIDRIAERHAGIKDWIPPDQRPLVSAQIIGNNVRVSILAFAFGIAACLPTLYLVYTNGLMLGVIGGAVITKSPHIAAGFFSFVAPHGVIELTAIFIAAGAGLRLGWSILCPGKYSRKDSLKTAGADAFVLVIGVASMLLVAGLIEAFFSPTMLPNSLKLTVAALLLFILYSYLFLGGKVKA